MPPPRAGLACALLPACAMLLAGCAPASPPSTAGAASTDLCADAAAHDPRVRDITLRALGSPQGYDKADAALAQAREDAIADCRRRNALPRAGSGVQPYPARDTLF